MSTYTLEILWYLIFVVVVIAYISLDGFDLGVGVLHMFARSDHKRRVFLNAIGPVWDGNEVWLVVLIGSLFAGFPYVYATLMSAFYTPVMFLISGLIFRAVAIEFRGKRDTRAWRMFWDIIFSLGSTVIALLLGFALGNLVQGIPLDSNFEFTGSFVDVVTPYTVLIALTTLALCTMHGSIFLVMKTEGELHDDLRKWVKYTTIIFVGFYAVTTMATLIYMPHMVDRFRAYPWIFFVALINLLAIINIPRSLNRGKDGTAFLSSCVTIASLVALYAIGTFPILLRAINDPENLSLTISNSHASANTLKVLLIIVIIGIPLALAYLITVYYLFRGKVKLDSHSY